MSVKELVLIRHGELPSEYAGRFVGSTDAPLGESGIEACRGLASVWRKRCGEGTVYVSPKLRARMSAELICGDHPVRVDERLREIDFGEWENLTFAEIETRDPDRCREWMAHPMDVVFPGGESFSGFCGRVAEFGNMLKKEAGDCTTVISHGGVLSHLICDLLGIPLSEMWRWQPMRGSLSVIEFDPEKLPGRFRMFNMTSDLLRVNSKVLKNS